MSDLADGFTWARRLKVRHLESLLVLEQAGTLTEAAVRLHMTQSAMSHWLAEMESLVGVPLVVRGGRRLELTPAGQLMKRLAISVLGDVSRAGQALNASARGKTTRLHVGSVWSGVARVLPMAVTHFQRLHPEVSVTVTEQPVGTLLERLARRDLDVVLGTIDARTYHSGLQYETLFEDDICVVVGRGSPLWGDTCLHPLGSLVHEQWIVPPKGTTMRGQWDSALIDAGAPWLQPKVETAAITTLLTLLHSGNYIGVCSEEMTRYQSAHAMVHKVAIDRVIRFGAVGVVWNKDLYSETIEAFVQIAREISRPGGTGPAAAAR